MTLGQLRKWMNDDHQFAMEIQSRAAQIAAGHVSNIRDKDDWRAWKFLLQHDPFSREEYGPQQSKNEGLEIILNIHRGEVVNEPAVVEGHREADQDTPCLESTEVLEPESKRPKECWQGDDWRARQTVDVSEDMVVAGVSELIGFDPEDGHFHDAATRIYRAMEEIRIDLLRNLEGLRELGQTDRR